MREDRFILIMAAMQILKIVVKIHEKIWNNFFYDFHLNGGTDQILFKCSHLTNNIIFIISLKTSDLF